MKKPLAFPDCKNPRGIPQAPFISSVDEYASELDDATALTGQLQQLFQKYQIMEAATTQRAKSLEFKIPDLKKSLEAVIFLQSKQEPFDTRYELNDTVFAKASVDPINSVWLWLGANIMLEYPIEEGRDLLQSKLDIAVDSLKNCQEDLEFLRENITTVEVNTARVINWSVSKQKQIKQ